MPEPLPTATDAAQTDPAAPPPPSPPRSRVRRFLWGSGLAVAVLLIFAASVGYVLHLPPADFPTDEPLVIAPGLSVDAILEHAVSANYARSPLLLYVILVMQTDLDQVNIQAGTYSFTAPVTASGLISRLLSGETTQELVRLTIPEGTPASTIAATAGTRLPGFDSATFLTQAEPEEGFLFPDTYFLPPTYTSEQLVTLLRETYEEKLAPYQAAMAEHPLTEYEIVTLASVIEREANDETSMRLVSGILQNRLAIDMPLQADASIEYVLDKPLSELTPADLEIETPYNTYLNIGLPPTPIGNPGVQAITAVLEPTDSDYFYYITGNDGKFYYAETYAEHQQNIARYLR